MTQRGAHGTLTQAVIETLAASANCSTEKRTDQAILYSTYSKKEIEEVVEQLKDIVSRRDCVNEQGLNADTVGNNDECAPFSSQVSDDVTSNHRNNSGTEARTEASRNSVMAGCASGGASAGDGEDGAGCAGAEHGGRAGRNDEDNDTTGNEGKEQ